MSDTPNIRKRLVTDEDHRPVAVQVSYADWLDIERRLGLAPSKVGSARPEDDALDLDALADAVRPHWQGGDGLEFQRRVRAEWTDPWETYYGQKPPGKESAE